MKLKSWLIYRAQQHAYHEYQQQCDEKYSLEIADVKTVLVQVKNRDLMFYTPEKAGAYSNTCRFLDSMNPAPINSNCFRKAKDIPRSQLHIIKSQRRSNTRIGFSPSSWFNGRMLEFYWSSGFSSLNVTLRYYNVVPRDSPIMELAREGDLAGVQLLLKNREASITDIDNLGLTVLDVRFTQHLVMQSI